jgi:hypothetical protein
VRQRSGAFPFELAYRLIAMFSVKGEGHVNVPYGFPCVSAQEKYLLLRELASVEERGRGHFSVAYAPGPQKEVLDYE